MSRHTRLSKIHPVVAAASCLALVVGLAAATSPPASASPAHGTSPTSATPSTQHRTGPEADRVVTAWSGTDGYHVAVGTGAGGYAWKQVAVLDPAGMDAGSWTGYQCLSGDGRYIAVVTLPTNLTNLQTARDRGGFAYSIDATTDTVRPVASGVAVKYFSPGCGTADDAVFTVSLSTDERQTEVVEADLATGVVSRSITVPGQLTSAVPTSDGSIVAAAGDHVVRVEDNGALTSLAAAGGDPYDLRPTAAGGVAFLASALTSSTSTAAVESGGTVTELGTGPKTRLQLFQGRVGRSTLTGSTSSNAAAATRAGVTVADDRALTLGADNASLDGHALLGEPATGGARADGRVTPQLTTVGAATSAPDALPAATTSAAVVREAAAYVPAGVLNTPASAPTYPKVAPRGDAAGSPAAGATPAAATSSQSPTCAVPRLDPTKQVMQPSPAQVTWASQLAEQGLLTTARPAGWDNLGLVSYAPSSDFPPIALSHPSGSSWSTVPASVYEAIMAQESNFSQASWHAPAGMAGDPLIADYYGAAGDIVSINYAGADCGYGVGQVTDGMHVGDTEFSAHGQIKIAVDYQENIAAGLQILESTWNQLYSDGIIANNGDPKDLENWYFAAWAYNSGIQPNGSYNTSGCTPGPSCTGPDGTWGLGWANNPANPDYPPNRAPYLQQTYADAAHPSSWAYEERIMGWMGSPIIRDNGPAYPTPTYHYVTGWLQTAPVTQFCSTAANDCNPNATNSTTPDAGHCMLNDYECWYHGSSTWISNCASTCATSSYLYSSGSSEPSNPNPNPPTCSQDTSKVPSGSIIVDDQPSPPTNLAGCGSSNWSSNGTFNYAYGTNSAGDPIGAIDTHQLGAGFGGHILFTHTETGSNPSLINTGTWTPNLPSLQYYTVKIHIPALGADATNVVYTVNPGGGVAPWKIRVNQAWNQETWVTIGTFAMQNGGNVVLTNTSPNVPGAGSTYSDFDVAFDAVAFVPKGGTPGTPIGGPPTVQDEPQGSNPAWVQCKCGQRTAGDPVNTATGYFGETFTDLSTPGRGTPLDLTRSYAEGIADPAGPNGSLAANGPFGWGWTYSYGLNASTNSTSGAVTITQEDNSRVVFTSNNGTYTTTEPRNDATLTKSGSTYTYQRRGTQVLTFDVSTGHLLSETDLAGANATTPYKTTFAYNFSGQLATITDPGNRVYTLTWTSGHITKVADTAGRTVTYGYDTSGDLTDVWGVGSTRSPSLLNDDHTVYSYNTTTHLLSSMRSPKNYGGAATAVTSMTYDSSERVTTQTDASGHVTTLNYGPSSTPSLSTGQVLVTDPAGHKELQTYQNGLLVTDTHGYGSSLAGTWTYTYDPVSLGVSTVVDPLGHTTTYSYDDHGNKIASSDALGNTTNWQYNAADQVTETVDPDGLATVNLYDQAGHVSTGTSTTSSGTYTWGDLTSSTVTLANNVVESITGNFGPAPTRTTNYYYDDAAHPGDRTRTVDARGHTVTATYDTAGDVVSATDADNRKTSYQWDTTRGWLVAQVAPTGTAAGVTGTCTPPAAGCTTFGHDLYGNVTLTTDPLGHTTKATFDADGNETSTTDADNNVTTYGYDPVDQHTTTTRADNTTLLTAYNGDGTVAYTRDAANNTTTYAYDARGRATSVTNPDNRVTTTGYDLADRATSMTSALNQTTTTGYDAAGHPTSLTYSDGKTPNVTNATFDPAGRPLGDTDGSGTTTDTYDAFGELASTTNGAGATTSYTYDANGNTATITYPSGGVVTDGYDNANQLTTVKDLAGNTTTFGYNADGLNTTTVLPNTDTITAGFNTADQQTTTTVTTGSTSLAGITYGRDNAGQDSGETPTGGTVGGTRNYGYNALQQVKSATISGTSSTYGYDAANDLTGNAATTGTFDPAQQLCWTTTSTVTGTPACGTKPSTATSYTYDNDGRRTAATPPTGEANTYGYDQANELTTSTVAGTSTTYSYDGEGQRVAKTTGGVTEAYTYADGQLLVDGTTTFVYGPGGLPLEQTSAGTTVYFVHDPTGSTRLLLGTSGPVSGAYAYNVYGAVTAHTGTASTPLQYGHGYLDSQTGLLYLKARYYDPATGQFLTIDPKIASTGNAYSYAGDNPVNNVDPLGLSWYNPASWSGKTWAYIGVGLGATALALTGVGIIADLGVGATIAVGAGATASGIAATALDAKPCIKDHDPIACGGLVMGGVGSLYGAAGAALDVAEAAGAGWAEGLGLGLDIQAMLLGGAGTGLDTYGIIKSAVDPSPEQKFSSRGGAFGDGDDPAWKCSGE